LEQAFILACRYGHIDLLPHLQNAGVHPTSHAVITAAQSGYLDIIEYLSLFAVDLHSRNSQAMVSAGCFGHIPVMTYLIRHGSDVNAQNDALTLHACSSGSVEVLKTLLTLTPGEIDVELALERAVTHYRLDCIQALELMHPRWQECDKGPALIAACYYGYVDLVEFLLERGADCHRDEDQCLVSAAMMGRVDVVEILVKWGVDRINTRAIDFARQYGRISVLEVLEGV
jgi:hypothetical protein